MGFFEAVSSVLSKYFTFSGRALRSEYWFWTLFYILGAIPVSILAGQGILAPYAIYSLAIFIPCLSVTARRLHDTNHSGWWAIIAIIPFGWLLLLYWLIKNGDPAKNRFGVPAYGSKSDNSSASQAARFPSNNERSVPIPKPTESRESIPKGSNSRPESSSEQLNVKKSNTSSSSTSSSEDIYFDNRRKKD
jgi:uncharacterized membrane protein YhaH (DUF805 family)